MSKANKLRGLSKSSRMAIRAWLLKINPYCCWCGDKMYLTASHGLEWMATIEHLFPLSAGGNNDINNIDLAHKRCNL